jgi:hypothetical protein
MNIEINTQPLDILTKKLTDESYFITGFLKDYILSGDFSAGEKMEISVKKLQLADIGITEAVSLDDVINQAKNHNLSLCAPEVALYYAFTGKTSDQVFIAMNPIKNTSSGEMVIFNYDKGFHSEQDNKDFVGTLGETVIHNDTKFVPNEFFLFCE